MSKQPKPFKLTEIEELVFDTNEHDQPWYYKDPYAGVPVDTGCRLHELIISFNFVIPYVVTEEDPPMRLLTVAKGLPGDSVHWPSWRDPVRLREVRGGIYAEAAYYPREHEIRVRSNAGGPNCNLVGVILEGASPERIRGRILELYVEISLDRSFASVNDRFLDGDLAIDAVGESTGEPDYPWGHDPSGNWFVASGLRDPRHAGPSSLPVGFGLSDLRITLGSESSAALGSIPYIGALDHLVDPFREDDENPFDAEGLVLSLSEKSLPENLFELAHELDWMFDDARRWAERARGLAEETEHLAMQLPEDLGFQPADPRLSV